MHKKTQEVCLEKGKELFVATKKSNRVAKLKVLKIIGASGLALFMWAGMLSGTIISACSTVTTNSATIFTNEDLIAQEQLLAGELKFDHQNDLVIYTTQSGIDIKYHNSHPGSGHVDDSISPYLSGYIYLTIGGMDYVFIGVNSNSKKNQSVNTQIDQIGGVSTDHNIFTGLDKTPAGLAILQDFFNTAIINTNNDIDNELEIGQVLCWSVSTTGVSVTGAAGYEGSGLQSYCNGLYETLTDSEKSLVVPVSFKSAYSDGYGTYYSESTNQTFFPLAAGTRDRTQEKYHIETYLSATSGELLISSELNPWWTRTGVLNRGQGYYYTNSGTRAYTSISEQLYCRPAFVLQLM